MDLSKISTRLENGFYRTKEIFCADFKKMFDNCRFYNDPSTEYYEIANKLEEFFKNKIKSF
jgi:histone acetyltransferase